MPLHPRGVCLVTRLFMAFLVPTISLAKGWGHAKDLFDGEVFKCSVEDPQIYPVLRNTMLDDDDIPSFGRVR
jgi:hypothetical protein